MDAIFNRCVIIDPELRNVMCLTPIMKSNIRMHHLHALASDDFRIAMWLGTHGAEHANFDEHSLIRQYRTVIDAELALSELSDVHMRVVANQNGVVERPIWSERMKEGVHSWGVQEGHHPFFFVRITIRNLATACDLLSDLILGFNDHFVSFLEEDGSQQLAKRRFSDARDST